MMNTIVDEKLISFKELEQKIFKYVCELGCEITKIILENYDDELAASPPGIPKSTVTKVAAKPV